MMKRKPLVVLLAALGLLAFLGTLIPYVSFFYGAPISSTDTTSWADFGSYFGGVTGPAIGILNLIVVAYIAVQITREQQHSAIRLRVTLDLYSEWHEKNMHESRTSVDELVKYFKKQKRRLPPLSELDKRPNSRASVHSFRVYHFFEKWAHLEEQGLIDSTLMSALMKNYTKWWNLNFFSAIRDREESAYHTATLEKISTLLVKVSR